MFRMVRYHKHVGIFLGTAVIMGIMSNSNLSIGAEKQGWRANPQQVESMQKRQKNEFIYSELLVPKYELPDPLVMADGTVVKDAETWAGKRRPEILELFRSQVYGKSPSRPQEMTFDPQIEKNTLSGKAVRKQVTVNFLGRADGPGMNILIYLPQNTKKAVPIFVGLNFRGNHTVHSDPGIIMSGQWMRPGAGVSDNKATEAGRGTSSSRWAVDKILSRGYGLATIYYGDIDPDYHDGFKNGVHPHFDKVTGEQRPGDAWGSIAAWAWGLSRAMDYFETDDDIDHKHVAVIGHSRLGKTSLWAGAQDERFALVISNNSGCGGAALNRRHYGETVKRINTVFPHWFCAHFKNYNDKENELPIDQHSLIALMAPRPVYVASADQDLWADPRGEFLSARHADPVYKLLGTEGLPTMDMPSLNEPVQGQIGYHVRKGKHDVTDYDWEQYLNFAEKHFKAN